MNEVQKRPLKHIHIKLFSYSSIYSFYSTLSFFWEGGLGFILNKQVTFHLRDELNNQFTSPTTTTSITASPWVCNQQSYHRCHYLTLRLWTWDPQGCRPAWCCPTCCLWMAEIFFYSDSYNHYHQHPISHITGTTTYLTGLGLGLLQCRDQLGVVQHVA